MKTRWIIGIIALIVIMALFFFTSQQLAVIVYDGNVPYKCGYFYEGIQSYDDVAALCEEKGFQCFTQEREGSLGTIYSLSCQKTCYECDGENIFILGNAPDCGIYNDVDEQDAVDYWADLLSDADLESKYCAPDVTCYKCIDGVLDDDIFKGSCPSSWSVAPSNCESNDGGYNIENNVCVYVTSNPQYDSASDCADAVVSQTAGYTISNDECVGVDGDATFASLADCLDALNSGVGSYQIINGECDWIGDNSGFETLDECIVEMNTGAGEDFIEQYGLIAAISFAVLALLIAGVFMARKK